MNIYYEINQYVADADREFSGIANWAQHNIVVLNKGEDVRFNYKAMQCADRAWEESAQGVKYIKYRFDSPAPKVDMEEFMWVKIKSKELIK